MVGYCRKCKKITRHKLKDGGYRCNNCGIRSKIEYVDKELYLLNRKGKEQY